MSRADSSVATLSAAKLALLARQGRQRTPERDASRHEPIAITGVGCRFPGPAHDTEELWRLLADGVDAVREVPPERFDVGAFFDADQEAAGRITTRQGAYLDDIEGFDAGFFGISPREATFMDPQQRLLLEVAWEALEDAGLTSEGLEGSRTGVFVAVYNHDYLRYQYSDPGRVEAYTSSGTAFAVAAGRLAFLLDLRGPAIVVDTACSSSLVALHQACGSLRAGECDAAVVGGVGLVLGPEAAVSLSRFGMLAPDGRCKSFDARADGFGRGEGCGVVVLKRLSDALVQGDRVRAVVRGSAINQDGRSTALTAPNGLAQRDVIRRAIDDAGVAPRDISFVEAHGTGTELGDPIEIEALGEVLGAIDTGSSRCALGSIKTNIGHLEAAAGVAGLIKTVVALENEALPPLLHFTALNPHATLEGTRLYIPTALEPWSRTDHPRFAGVSSFGFSGTNAHVVVEEAPRLPARASREAGRAALLPISARDPGSLRERARQLAVRLEGSTSEDWADVCFTAATRRTHHEHRLAVVGDSAGEMVTSLRAFAGDEAPRGATPGVAGQSTPRVAFVFCGQGPQRWGMGRELMGEEAVFRAALERCDGALRPHAGWSVLEELARGEGDTRLARTAFAQPALFSLHVALAELWRSWGVVPSLVVGHSVGEVAAAHVAGVLSLNDAARLVVARGELMDRATGNGAMASLELDEESTAQLVDQRVDVSIAAVNGPRSTVVSGPPDALQAVLEEATRRAIGFRTLPVDYAFHSPQMEPLATELEARLAGLQASESSMPMVSTTTGALVSGVELGARHWADNVRRPVRFAASVARLLDLGAGAFVEVGPHPVLTASIEASAGDRAAVVAPSLRRDRPERAALLGALGTLWTAGVRPDWDVALGGRRRVVSLPRHPWTQASFPVPRPYRAGHRESSRRFPLPGHPLRGEAQASPLCEASFVAEVSEDRVPFLADHRLSGRSVMPAAAFLEIALSAGREILGTREVALVDVELTHPLAFAPGERRELHTVIERRGAAVGFSFHSTRAGRRPWTHHGGGGLGVAGSAEEPLEGLDEVRSRCPQLWDSAGWYREIEGIGPDFGPRFRAVVGVAGGEAESLGEIALPEVLASEQAGYLFHPCLLDACLQVAAAALPDREETRDASEVLLPVALDGMRLLRQPATRFWVHARRRPEPGSAPGGHAVDLDVRGEDGLAVARLEGLRLRRSSRTALERSLRGEAADWLCAVGWKEISPAPKAAAEAWLVVGDREVTVPLGTALERRGQHVFLAESEEEVSRVLERNEAVAGVADLSSLRVTPGEEAGAGDVQADAVGLCSRTLGLAQRLTGGDRAVPRLALVTRGAQAARPGEDAPQPVHAALWGLRSVLALEQPALRCRAIDLEGSLEQDEVDHLAAEVLADDGEDEVALRSGRRFAARLVKLKDDEASEDAPAHSELQVLERGLLDNLVLRPQLPREPGPGEVEIEVRATGLNFRDVLNVLGLYPGDPGPLGDECAGVVRAVGAGVERFAPGDEVVTLAAGAFRSLVTAPEALVVDKPPELSFEDAAAVPIAFLTAEWALGRLAGLRAGQSVLIHAATGGVGLAAVRLAMQRGAEVFATAGSDEKRGYLRQLGVSHVMDSRSLGFAEDVMTQTGGRGVDVVLNSLAGDFIAKSLGVVRRGGTFVEIGRTDVWTEARVAELDRGISYHVLYLGAIRDEQPRQLRELLSDLLERLSSGGLELPPIRVFPLAEVRQGFRFMAQARHKGKIVFAHPALAREAQSASLDPEGVYLVTGAFGGLGVHATRALVEAGARSLILVGRHAPSGSSLAAVRELEAAGIRVRIAEVDVSDESGLRKALFEGGSLGRLRGVVHAAGVLDDAALSRQDAARLERVLAPKVAGAWALHRVLKDARLDFFILYAAGAALLGSRGQANYAAANAFLDALAAHRRARGMPALSIDWGAWSEVGMAARLSDRERQRITSRGLAFIDPDEGRELLRTLITTRRSRVVAVPARWDEYISRREGPVPSLLRDLVDAEAAAPASPGLPDGELARRVLATAVGRRRAVLQAALQGLALRVLGLPPDTELDPSRPLRDLGLDSLLSVELRNAVSRTVGIPLPATLLFDHPSLVAVADHLLERIPGLAGDVPDPDTVAGATPAGVEPGIVSLSDAEAEAALVEELDSLREERGRA